MAIEQTRKTFFRQAWNNYIEISLYFIRILPYISSEMKNRVLETVTGYEQAIESLAGWVRNWNACTEEGRMVYSAHSKLEAYDDEGSGAFLIAVCLNANEAEDNASEIWEIQTDW